VLEEEVELEDSDSRVRIVSTAMTDLRGVARMLLAQPSTVRIPQRDHHISVI
jgi:hypothetical protein